MLCFIYSDRDLTPPPPHSSAGGANYYRSNSDSSRRREREHRSSSSYAASKNSPCSSPAKNKKKISHGAGGGMQSYPGDMQSYAEGGRSPTFDRESMQSFAGGGHSPTLDRGHPDDMLDDMPYHPWDTSVHRSGRASAPILYQGGERNLVHQRQQRSHSTSPPPFSGRPPPPSQYTAPTVAPTPHRNKPPVMGRNNPRFPGEQAFGTPYHSMGNPQSLFQGRGSQGQGGTGTRKYLFDIIR